MLYLPPHLVVITRNYLAFLIADMSPFTADFTV
jgi:hypothetical protein